MSRVTTNRHSSKEIAQTRTWWVVMCMSGDFHCKKSCFLRFKSVHRGQLADCVCEDTFYFRALMMWAAQALPEEVTPRQTGEIAQSRVRLKTETPHHPRCMLNVNRTWLASAQNLSIARFVLSSITQIGIPEVRKHNFALSTKNKILASHWFSH